MKAFSFCSVLIFHTMDPCNYLGGEFLREAVEFSVFIPAPQYSAAINWSAV